MTETDSKEWVTIKVPQAVRDEARDDPRTYGQVLRAGLEHEPFGGSITDADVERLIDTIAAEADGQGRVDDSELAREVARQMDYGELANAVADELEARRR
jgi:hypothetical protein